MIRCPSCGTFNHDSQRVCRSCGSALPQTRRRCPECGTLNPVGNLFCDRCNARLVEVEDIPSPPAPDNALNASGGVKGISLPTRSVSSEAEAPQSPELPAWLAGLVDEETEFGLLDPASDDAGSVAQEPGLAASVLPDWLSGDGGHTAAGGDAVDTPSLPDWLTGGADDPSSSRRDAADDDVALPDWLGGLPESDDAAQLTPPVAPEPHAPGDDGISPEGIADAEIISESELPDWLRQTSSVVPASGSDGAIERADEGLETVSAESTETIADDAMALPDWLQQIAAEEAGSEQVPDWLSALTVEKALPEPEADTGVFVPGTEGTGSTPIEADEGADWLSAPDVGAAAPPESGVERVVHVFEEGGELSPAELASAEAAHPAWLADLAPADTPASPQPEAKVFTGDAPVLGARVNAQTPALEAAPEATEEIPDWLEALDLVPPESTPVQELPAQPADLPQADLPEWLQELAPPGVLAATSGEPTSGASDVLEPAEIPEWVEALRPEARAAGAPPPGRAVLPTPPEPEGPLEGLAGVLPTMGLVDMPADGRPALSVGVPDPVVAQAQLWQRLLEQPRRAERSISYGRPSTQRGTSWLRWLIALLLFAGLFAAFWLVPQGLRLAQVSPTRIAPGVPALVESIERLGTGDTVVLAIEYSPAYADEMEQVAAPILAHLDSRGVESWVASSLPEGVGLGYALPSLPGTRPVGGDGYLAGGATGIATFLTQPDAAEVDQVLVLGSEPQRVTWWLEQNALRGTEAFPIGVGLSASAGPVLAPYLASGQVEGWVTGLPQALAYREIRGDGHEYGDADLREYGDADLREYGRILDLLMIAHWSVAALLLVAFFYNLFVKRGAR